MLYIVAGNNNEYRNWVAQQKTFHPSETRYVSNADQLRGMSTLEGRFIGTCYDRSDIVDIVTCINVIRSRTKKPIVLLESLRHLSAYEVMDTHFRNVLPNTTTSSSHHNIPVYTTGITTASQTYLSSMSGKTASTAIFDELPSSFKVPLSIKTTAGESMFILKVAKTYNSYITNTYNAMDSTIEYYFNDKDDALHFANVYDSQAYEYK